MFGRFKRRPGGAEMFERFTDRARRVIVLAQEEARQLNHNYVGTEHILLGLIREGHGVAAEALAAMRISLDEARREVEAIIGRGTEQPSGHIPFTPRTQKVLQFSSREAQQLGHSYVGTEHILLGRGPETIRPRNSSTDWSRRSMTSENNWFGEVLAARTSGNAGPDVPYGQLSASENRDPGLRRRRWS
jgi:ATP-dependent Clp protease ATP-binding subunit ClpA